MSVRRKLRALAPLAVLTAALALAACGSSDSGSSESGSAAASTTHEQLDALTLQGPETTLALSLPFLRVVEGGALAPHAGKVAYEPWRTPDELRARLASGEADVSAVPTYVGANLYNRGLDVRLVNVLVWGMLYVVGPDGETVDWSQLRGETVLVPFKGDMPDLVFRHLATENGLDPATDLDIRYVSAPPEAVQMLIGGQAPYAVLPEHLATVAIAQGAAQGKPLARLMNLQEEWSKVTGGESGFPQAGILVSGELADEHPELVEALQQDLAASVDWINSNAGEAARLAGERIEGMKAPIAEQAIPNLNLRFSTAADSRAELEAFFTELAELSPEIIGGKLPDDGFYYQE